MEQIHLVGKEQGTAMVLYLEGDAHDAVLEWDNKLFLLLIIARLNIIYTKEELTRKCCTLESFQKYKRKIDITIRNFQGEFEKLFPKGRRYGTIMSDELLLHHPITSAKSITRDKQPVKATINKFKFGYCQNQANHDIFRR